MRRPIAYALLTLAASHVACGLSHTVEPEVLRQLAIEHKLQLFDAQNEVAITMDERDQIRRSIQDLKQDIADVERQIVDAYGDAARASEKGDDKGVEVAELAVETYELKLDYLDMRIEHERSKLEAQDGLVEVALAKFELAKATLIKQNNIRGASDIDLEDYEEQVGAYVEAARAMQLDVKEVEGEVDEAKNIWMAKREELSEKSGGALGNPWVEEAGAWDTW